MSTVLYHGYKMLKDIGRVKKYFTREHLETLVCAVTSSRLDYCNALFMNIGSCNMKKLQRLQNSSAKLILARSRRDSATASLQELHWLSIEKRVTFKILLMAHKVMIGHCPENLTLQAKDSGRGTGKVLEEPAVKTKYGKRMFGYNAPRLWNALPLRLQNEENTENFKKELKTVLFEGHDELLQRAFKYLT